MADTERLMNKAQGDDIISALGTIASNILQVPSEKLIIDWSYTTLPASGNDHTIYAIPTGDADDPWDFYVWNNVDEEWVQFDWNFAVDSALSTTSENPVQNKVVKGALDDKVDKVAGKGLSTNDYTNEEKALVATVPNKADSVDVAGTQTVSGNPLTLTDAAPINAESLVVELEPKQDLHGYDNPWPAGGGMNQFDTSLVTFWDNGLGISFEASGQYIRAHGTYTGSSASPQLRFAMFTNSKSLTGIKGFPISGFNNEWYRVRINGNDLAVDFQNMVTNKTYDLVFAVVVYDSSQTAPTAWTPYSNICPITGYTECDVDDVGFNRWDEEWELGALNTTTGENTSSSNQIRSKNYIPVVANTGYYGMTSTNTVWVMFYDASKNVIHITGDSGSARYVLNSTFTTPSNCAYIRFYLLSSYGTTYNHDISINYPSTVTTYQPYHSSNATIQFGQTVYGGEVDFLTGVLTVDMASVDLGSLTWAASSAGSRFYANVPSPYYKMTRDAKFICSQYIDDGIGSSGRGYYGDDGTVRHNYADNPNPSAYEIYIHDDRFGTDANEFKTAMNGVQLCYELATPIEIQLTPQELQLLKQYNHITTNGTTINLGYQPDNVIGDVKGEIEKCAVDAEFMQFTDGTDTFTDVNLSLDALSHTVSVVGSKIEQKRFICFEVMDKMGGVLQGILASCIAFTDGAKTPSGTSFRAYIDPVSMYVDLRICGSGGSYMLSYQSETSFSASAFYVRVRMMNNL